MNASQKPCPLFPAVYWELCCRQTIPIALHGDGTGPDIFLRLAHDMSKDYPTYGEHLLAPVRHTLRQRLAAP